METETELQINFEKKYKTELKSSVFVTLSLIDSVSKSLLATLTQTVLYLSLSLFLVCIFLKGLGNNFYEAIQINCL